MEKLTKKDLDKLGDLIKLVLDLKKLKLSPEKNQWHLEVYLLCNGNGPDEAKIKASQIIEKMGLNVA